MLPLLSLGIPGFSSLSGGDSQVQYHHLRLLRLTIRSQLFLCWENFYSRFSSSSPFSTPGMSYIQCQALMENLLAAKPCPPHPSSLR